YRWERTWYISTICAASRILRVVRRVTGEATGGLWHLAGSFGKGTTFSRAGSQGFFCSAMRLAKCESHRERASRNVLGEASTGCERLGNATPRVLEHARDSKCKGLKRHDGSRALPKRVRIGVVPVCAAMPSHMA